MASVDFRWAPTGEPEQAAVREQLERILEHPVFKNSPRCQNLLRYVVDHSLRGDCEQIKERTLGIEVFGRKADYDMSQDHVVRAAAAEVRKRLAQYYQEPVHETEIIIQLNPGSYIPEFQWPGEPPEKIPARLATRRSNGLILALAIAMVVVVIAAILLRWKIGARPQSPAQFKTATETSVMRIWRQMLLSPGPVLICVGEPQSETFDGGASLQHAFALARLTEFLGQRNQNVELRTSSSLSSPDLNHGPVILIGEFVNGNSWAIDVTTGRGRYQFEGTPGKGLIWIEDLKNPSAREWSIDTTVPPSKLKQDYAIVERTTGKTGHSPGFIVAGLGENGTVGAINCLMDTRCLDLVLLNAPKGSSPENLEVEIVLAIPLVDGIPRPAQVVSANFW